MKSQCMNTCNECFMAAAFAHVSTGRSDKIAAVGYVKSVKEARIVKLHDVTCFKPSLLDPLCGHP